METYPSASAAAYEKGHHRMPFSYAATPVKFRSVFALFARLLPHHLNLYRPLSPARLIQIDKIQMAKLAEIQLTVHDYDRLAAPEKHRSQVSVCIERLRLVFSHRP